MATPPTMRIGEGVTPPTNRWYSSLAFGDGGLPVFPRPLSFTPTESGFAMGLTRPHASQNAIVAPAMNDIEVHIEGAASLPTVSSAGPVAVTLTTGPAELTLAQGWPAVGVRAAQEFTATLSIPFRADGDNVATASVGQAEYGVVVTGGRVDGDVLTLEAEGSAILFAVPESGNARAMAEALGAVIPSDVRVKYSVDDQVTTTVTYADDPTVLTLPERRANDLDADCTLGMYETIHGPYAVCAAASLTWSVPRLEESASLDLSRLTAEETQTITEAVRQDLATPGELPNDTYFGSKALYRLANLVQIADAVGATSEADAGALLLEEQLRLWGDPQGCAARADRCFVYDSELHGVVGLAPSFGSEEFNDHHFHYGYLLHAAAVAVARNSWLAQEIGPVMDLVAADIASPTDTGTFPERRAFDPVAGHSWASGYSPFADGNNQESSSEAVTAWNAVALWAEVRGNDELLSSARWMLSAEAASSRDDYLAPDLGGFDAYGHGIVALDWGAKRDYATWFSAEPNAILGIELIPAPPNASAYWGLIDDEAILRALEEATPAGYDVQFGDYMLMYLATVDGQASNAWDQAIALPDESIDGANSRAYLLAWIAAQRGSSS